VPRPLIIDAGPALNFFATNNERLLLSVVGGFLSAPETVADEVKAKAASDQRLRAAGPVWVKLERAKRIVVLSDDATDELEAAIQRLAQMPMAQRITTAKDLGETMVVAHAAVAVESGRDVAVLIDDAGGARLADNERRRFERLRAQGKQVGTLRIYNTLSVMEAAGRTRLITGRAQMRKVYAQLRACDDGLVDIGQTNLLSADLWSATS
jgi:hypothetical protein